jgi:hypothetical protein
MNKWGTLVLLLFLPVSTFGFLKGNELINIPSAKMEKQGFVEIGGGIEGGQNASLRTLSTIFMRWAVSNQIEYGIAAQNNRMLHNIQFAFIPIGTDSKMSCLSFGIKNIGYDGVTTNVVSSTLYGGFATYSFQLVDYGALFHLGFGEDLNTRKINGFGGLELNTFFGTLMMEWDGGAYHLGVKNVFEEQIKLVMGFQFRQTRLQPGEIPGTFKVALSFMDAYTPPKTKEVSVRKRFRPDSFFEKPQPIEPFVPTASIPVTKNTASKPLVPTVSIKPVIPTSAISVTVNIPTASPLQKLPTANALKIADPVILNKSIMLMQQGMRYYYQGQYLEALSNYQDFIKLNPSLATGYISLGSIYLQLGLPNDAIKQWQKALELEPDNAQVKVFLNQLLSLKKE